MVERNKIAMTTEKQKYENLIEPDIKLLKRLLDETGSNKIGDPIKREAIKRKYLSLTYNPTLIEKTMTPKQLFTTGHPLWEKPYTINEIDEGEVKVCALENCTNNPEPGTYEVGDKLFSVGSDKEAIEIEHFYGESEKCTITLKLKVKELGSDKEKEGPSITVKFDTDPTAIAEVASQRGLTYDVFNTQGMLLYKQITSLSNLPKGIYIVKKKGVASTKKYVVR